MVDYAARTWRAHAQSAETGNGGVQTDSRFADTQMMHGYCVHFVDTNQYRCGPCRRIGRQRV